MTTMVSWSLPQKGTALMQTIKNVAVKQSIMQFLNDYCNFSEQIGKLVVHIYKDTYNSATTQMKVHETKKNKPLVFLAGHVYNHH